MELGIIVRRGGALVSAHLLSDEVIKIGRAERSHIQLPDDAVARMHAVLERRDGGWRIIDLGSASGTLVGGRKVNSGPLAVRDVIEIGPFALELVPSHELAAASRGTATPSPSADADADAPPLPSPPCPACGNIEPRLTTELRAEFTAPDLAFDAPEALTRLRAEFCRACGHIAFFLRDPKSVLPPEG